MLQLRAPSLDATRAIAAAVAACCCRGDVLVLSGEMGAGKTAFAQGFAAAVGVGEPVTSPTFTLVHTYDSGRLPLFHADLYRLSTHHEIDELGLTEMVEGGVLLVEWGEVAAATFGEHLVVQLVVDPNDDAQRLVTVRGVGRSWATRWETLGSATQEWAC
jgi:tRNA threonylcarbamoyladenosine biosynthesis protein TsaE